MNNHPLSTPYLKYDDTHSDQKFSESEIYPLIVETPTKRSRTEGLYFTFRKFLFRMGVIIFESHCIIFEYSQFNIVPFTLIIYEFFFGTASYTTTNEIFFSYFLWFNFRSMATILIVYYNNIPWSVGGSEHHAQSGPLAKHSPHVEIEGSLHSLAPLTNPKPKIKKPRVPGIFSFWSSGPSSSVP